VSLIPVSALGCAGTGCEAVLVRRSMPLSQLRAEARTHGWSTRPLPLPITDGDPLEDFCPSCTHGLAPRAGLLASDVELGPHLPAARGQADVRATA
jgi:hypothetical protein